MRSVLIMIIILNCIACKPGSGTGLIPDSEISDSDLLSRIQSEVFTPICSQCHFGQQAPAGLRLDSAELSYEHLVNIPADGNSQYQRVVPYDAANSYLWLKITGSPIAGQRMPLGQAPLPHEQIQLVEDWIDQGAQPAQPATTVVSKISVTRTSAAVTVDIWFSGLIDVYSFDDIRGSLYLLSEDMPPELIKDLYILDHIDYIRSNHIGITITVPARNEYSRYLLSLDSTLEHIPLDIYGALIDMDNDGNSGGKLDVIL